MKKMLFSMGLLWLSGLLPALASETGDAAPGMTWSQIIEAGGVLIYVLAAMSVAALAMVIYFIMTLRREQILPGILRADLAVQLRNRDFRSAEKACEGNPCPLSAIALSAIRHQLRTGTLDAALLRESMEGEGGRQATLLQNRIQYMLDVAIIAPMIGLLGTVMGMLRAFNSVALDIARARPLELAECVAQALVTTIAGLIVAIPAMVAYAYFRGRTTRLIADLEAAAADIAADLQENAR